MFEVLNDVKVVEVGSFVFVPLASAVLADWGAEVIKVEHPETGDPYRGLITAGMPSTIDGVDLSFQSREPGKTFARARPHEATRAASCWANWWLGPTSS